MRAISTRTRVRAAKKPVWYGKRPVIYTPRQSPVEPLERRVLLTNMVSGQTIAATLASAGQHDTYTFIAFAGNTFEFSFGDASSASKVEPNLTVDGPVGTAVGSSATQFTNDSVRVVYTVPSGDEGTYTAIVQDNAGTNTGAYDVKLVIASGTAATVDSDGDGGPIVSGQTIAGSIAHTGDLDIYTFSAAAGNTFEFSFGDANSSSGVAPNLLVYNPSGTLVGSDATQFVNDSVRAIYTVPTGAAGVYTAFVQDNSGAGTGAYDVKLALASGTAATVDSDGDSGPIVSGQTIAGTITRTGDLDIYTFSAAAGNTFEFSFGDANSSSGVAPNLLVYNPSGTEVGSAATQFTKDSVRVIYTVPSNAAGIYTAIVQDNSASGTGAYDVKLALASGTAATVDADGDSGPILSGQTIAGTITRAGDLDIYTFSVAAGNSFEFSFGDVNSSSGVAPNLLVYNPSGTEIGSAASQFTNDSVRVIYTVPSDAAGIYTAFVQDNSGTGTGAYAVKLVIASGTAATADNKGDGGPIVSGQTIAGTIARTGDLDIYTFSAAAGNTFEFSFGDANSSSGVAPNLLVYNPSGTEVGSGASQFTNDSVRVIYNVPSDAAGIYTAIVQDNSGTGTGAYAVKLVIASGTAATADNKGDGGPIVSGQTIAGLIGHTGDLDIYTFSVAAGNTFEFSFGDANSSSGVDPNLLVYNPTGTEVGSDATQFANDSVRVIYTVPSDAAGIYTAFVQDNSGGSTGAYDVKLAIASGTAATVDADGDSGPILSGQTITGSIAFTGDLDIYTFTALVGDKATLTLADSNATSPVEPNILVYNPSGAFVGSNATQFSNSSLPVNFTTAADAQGLYTVIVQDNAGNHTGGYTLNLTFNTTAGSPSIIQSGPTVIGTGTTLDDTSSVSVSGSNVIVTIDSTSETIPASTFTGINLDLGADDDSANIAAGVPPVTVGGAGGSDTIVTDNADDSLRGGHGNDMIVAGRASDTAVGGNGNDTLATSGAAGTQLFGGPQDDLFINANGAGDSVNGGPGLNFAQENDGDTLTGIFETYDPNPSDAQPALDTVADSAGGDDLQVFGTSGNDSITLSENAGTFVVVENGGSPQLYPAAGITGVLLAGGLGDDTLIAETSVLLPVTLRGAKGNDSMVGGGGDNVIVGGQGNDTLQGGDGTNDLAPGRRVTFEDSPSGNDMLIGGPAGSTNFADFAYRTDNLFLSNNGLPDSGDTSQGESTTIMPSVQNIFAGTGQDTVISTVAGSFISAGVGQDSLTSGGINTTLVAGPPGAGEDTVIASGSVNALYLQNGHADEYQGTLTGDILQTDVSDVLQ